MKKIIFFVIFFAVFAIFTAAVLKMQKPMALKAYYSIRLALMSGENADLSFLDANNPVAITMLEKVLGRDDSKKQISALILLAGSNKDIASDKILDLFASPNPEVRKTAVEVMVKLQTPEINTQILSRLENPQSFVETESLLNYCYQAKVQGYKDLVKDKFAKWDKPKRFATAKYVFDEYYYAVIAKLKAKNRYIRGDAVMLLGLLANPETLPFILDATNDPGVYVRVNAAYALSFFHADKRLKEDIIKKLCNDDSLLVRKAIATSLGVFEGHFAFERLAELVTDGAWEVRYDAVMSLIMQGRDVIVPLVINAINDRNPYVKGAGLIGSAVLGASSEKSKAASMLEDKNQVVAAYAAYASGLFFNHKVIPELIDMLSSSRENVRAFAAQALSFVGENDDGIDIQEAIKKEKIRKVKAKLIIALSEAAPDKVGLDTLEMCQEMYPDQWDELQNIFGGQIDQFGFYVLVNLLEFTQEQSLNAKRFFRPAESVNGDDPVNRLAGHIGFKDVISRKKGGISAGKVLKVSPESYSMDIGGGIDATITHDLVDRIEFNKFFKLFFFYYDTLLVRTEIETLKRRRHFIRAYDRLQYLEARERIFMHLNPVLAQEVPLLKKIHDDDKQHLEEWKRELCSGELVDAKGNMISGESFLTFLDQRYPSLYRDRTQKVKALKKKVSASIARNDIHSAIEYLREILKISRYDLDAKYMLVDNLIKLEDFDAAVKELESIIAINPKRTEAYYRISGIYRKSLRFDDSFRIMDRLEQVMGASAQIHFDRGLTYKLKGDTVEAVKQWQEAMVVDPLLFDPYFMMAVHYANVGNYKESLVVLNNGIVLEINNPAARSFLGLLYLYFGDNQKAVENCRKAVEIKPGNIDYLYSLGNVYAQVGDYAKARETFGRALKLDPDEERIQKAFEKIAA